MILTNIIFTLALAITMSLTSPSSISGYIIDKETNETLTGVKVTVNDSISVYTNFDGYFEIKNISDTLNMKIEYISYKTMDMIVYKNDQNQLSLIEKVKNK
jgi:hypothetical protein